MSDVLIGREEWQHISVDSRGEPGEGMGADAGELVNSRKPPEDGCRLDFNMTGEGGTIGQDHVIMNDFLHYAKELRVGQEVELEFIPEDSKNPYQFVSEQVFAAK